MFSKMTKNFYSNVTIPTELLYNTLNYDYTALKNRQT